MHTSMDVAVQADYLTMPLLDEDGFLVDPYEWTPQLADRLAASAALPPLDRSHYQIIAFLRDKYLSLGAMPPMRQTCRKTGLGRHQIKHQFGGCRQLRI